MSEIRKAVVIGIDAYQGENALRGCVKDAVDVEALLKEDGFGNENFETVLLTSALGEVTATAMKQAVGRLFAADASIAVFYFAGHGWVDEDTHSPYLVSQNGTSDGLGLSLNDLIALANRAYPKVQSTVIILDCCHAGIAGEVSGYLAAESSVIGTGVTILAAAHRDQAATEDGQGLFTGILLDGLRGSASDVLGNITPGSLYTLMDQTFGGFDQRPIYKANVQRFISLRQVPAKIPRETLRKLPIYFRRPDDLFSLGPTHESDRKNIPPKFRKLPQEPDKVAIFKELQACNRQGLVVPVEANHMYDAAIRSKWCKLTPAGMHYRRLAELGRFGPVKP